MMMDGTLEEIATEFVDLLKVARVQLDLSPNLDCGTGSDVFQRFCIFSDGEVRIGIFGTRTRKQFFPS